MTRRMLLVFTFLLGTLLSAVGVATAQDTETDIDIAAIGEVVLDSDPQILTEGLESPPDDAELPEGFVNPPGGSPQHADLIAEFTGEIGQIDDAIGNVSHAFDTDPDVVSGEISTGIITYLVTEEEITAEDLDLFEEGASEGFDTATPSPTDESEDATPSSAPVGTVERIELGGAEAVVITVVTEEGGNSAVVQIVAVPVGNTLVIGTTLVADQGTVDAEDVLSLAEELTLAGVAYLETVAENAQ